MANSEYTDDPSTVTPAMEAAANSITYSWYGKSLALNTGPLDKAFDALRMCTNEMLKQWGLDPEQQLDLKRLATPVSDPARWVKPLDYPRGQLSAGQQGLVSFRVLVTAEGEPEECEIQRSYSDEKFNKATCDAIMRRASFEPALDDNGALISSYYANSVSFNIPRH